MRPPTMREIGGFLIASLAVGFLLDTLDIAPITLWHDFWNAAAEALSFAWNQAGHALQWILLGAVVVAPVFLIRWLIANARGLRQHDRRQR